MKKFLTMLLALSVVFTYTFGAAGSVFADTTTLYTKDKANALLDYAYSQAKAIAIEYNYDGNYGSQTDVNGTDVDDITVFNFKAEYVQKAIDKAYTDAIVTADVTNATPGTTDKIAGVSVAGTFTDANKTTDADAFAVRNALLTAATLAGTNAEVIEKAAWSEYKEMLTKLVESVDLSIYTDTVKESVDYTVNYPTTGTKYNTSKAAAEAIIKLAKKTIAEAEYAHTTTSGKYTYDELYDAIFDKDGADSTDTIGAIAVKENKDDEYKDSLVTSLTYVLSAQATDRTLSTVTSEKQDAANDNVNKATAKNLLVQDVTNFINSDSYSTKYDALIAAYQEATEYLIDNDTAIPATNKLALVRTNADFSIVKDATSGNYVIVDDKGTPSVTADDVKYDYIAYCAEAKTLNTKAAQNKSNAAISGVVYDETKAAKALKAALVLAYKGSTPSALYTGETKVTAGEKAAAKLDVTKVKATSATVVTGVTAKVFQLPVTLSYNSTTKKTTITSTPSAIYFEAQWKDVVAAIDTYNVAIDAAVNEADVDDAKNALYTAISNVEIASNIYTEVAKNTNTSDLNKYAALAYARENAGKTTPENIYVTFTETVAITSSTVPTPAPIVDSNVNLWYIAQGATTKAEATAMYADACKVIDGYKTATEEKAAADAVKAQIVALPTTVALTDKDAIVAAYDAYAALNPSYTKYVTNFGTLKDAVKAVYKLELNSIRTLKAAIPAKITSADRAVVEAAEKAYAAYDKTTAYTNAMLDATKATFVFTAIDADLEDAELADITEALSPLQTKWVANALTADDAAAVETLKTLVAAYIENWTGDINYALVAGTESLIDTIASTVDKAVKEAEEAKKAEEEKAALETKLAVKDSKAKFASSKAYKNSIKLTFNKPAVGVDGYVVYMATKKNGLYKKVATVKTNTYTKKSLKKGTAYYFKVKAYKVVDGKKVYTQTSGKLCKKTTK